MSSYVLGIDAGTESIRAAVFDERGICKGFGSAENKNHHPFPGWAEQSVQEWEAGLYQAIRASIANSKIRPEQITGISVDGTSCTVVFLDKEGRPLRNALIWMDVRSFEEAELVASTKVDALKYVGFGNVSAEWFPCKALWIKKHEPRIYEQTATMFEQTDWLVYTLTGEKTLNINTTSVRWFYNSRQGGLPKDLYERIGLGDIFQKLPGTVLSLGAIAGRITKTVGEKTGLKPGTPVAAGGADAFIGILGVNALTPGTLALITGSSQLQLGLLDKEIHAPGLFGTYPDAVLPGLHVVEAGQISTGSVVKWFKDGFVSSSIEQIAASRGLDTYDILNEGAERIPPGSEGLITLEHWQGNRTPWVDPTSRGVIRGLTLHHSPYHVFRSILEGVAYGTAVILGRMEQEGVSIRKLIACGGATKSRLWMQIHADVTGREIVITEEQQAVVLGSAILAAVGAGIYSSIAEAAENMVRIRTVVEPDPKATEAYVFYIDQYAKTYEALKDDAKNVVRHEEKRQGK